MCVNCEKTKQELEKLLNSGCGIDGSDNCFKGKIEAIIYADPFHYQPEGYFEATKERLK
jgi:hypothetical protein